MWIAIGVAISFVILTATVAWIVWHVHPERPPRPDRGPYPTMAGQLEEYKRRQREKGYQG